MIAAKEYSSPYGGSIAIGLDLATVFDYSAALCAKRPVSRSYTSILLCLRIAPNELSQSFHAFISPATLEKIALHGRFSLPDVLQLPYFWQEGLGQKFPAWGANLTPLVADAKAIAGQVSTQAVIDVRHMMAAYIYDPSKKNQELLQAWDLAPQPWAEWFLQQMAELWPNELDNWRSLHKSRGHHNS